MISERMLINAMQLMSISFAHVLFFSIFISKKLRSRSDSSGITHNRNIQSEIKSATRILN